jgi:hypothetical protein
MKVIRKTRKQGMIQAKVNPKKTLKIIIARQRK